MLDPVSREKIDIAERDYGNRISMMLACGNFSGAREILGEAEYCSTHPERMAPILDVPIAELHLIERTTNVLERLGVLLVRDLITVPSTTLLAANGIGPPTLDVTWQAVLRLAVSRDSDRADLEFREFCRGEGMLSS